MKGTNIAIRLLLMLYFAIKESDWEKIFIWPKLNRTRSRVVKFLGF